MMYDFEVHEAIEKAVKPIVEENGELKKRIEKLEFKVEILQSQVENIGKALKERLT